MGHCVFVVQWIKSQALPEGPERECFPPAQAAPCPWGSYPVAKGNNVAPWQRRGWTEAPSPFQSASCMENHGAGFLLESNTPLLNCTAKMRHRFPDPRQSSKILPLWSSNRTNDTEGRRHTTGMCIYPAESCKKTGSPRWVWQQGFTLPKHVSLLLALCMCRSR